MAKDPEIQAHQEWMGYVQPVGLVVSPPALVAAQAYVSRAIVPEHQRFLEHVEDVSINGGLDKTSAVMNFPRLMEDVFGWDPNDLVDDASLNTLEVNLATYGETLRPTFAVREVEPGDGACPWLMLIQNLELGRDFDAVPHVDDRRWEASPQARFERLLRETKVPIGLLFNGTHLRLTYAPSGETSGYMDFPVAAMAKVDGRPIFAGLQLLLSSASLFTNGRKQRLPYILTESRKYQNLVSTQLSEQVLHSLYELLRGFQAADDMAKGELLRQVLKEDPNHVYAGLLNVLLRLVFVLYAEDRGLMPGDSVYGNFYSINGLFERLRSDASRFPDTMDQRYGAWAQLLSLFRLIHDGASHGAAFKLPPRQGHLFNPDRYPFLEGRPYQSTRQINETVQPPMVSDGIVFRVLHNLLILDGERISYRTLDVEQIGSVYETVMGFTLEVAQGRSIAIKPVKPHGAPLTINLEELLAVKPAQRAKWVKDTADQSITGESLKALQAAQTPEDLVAALGKKASPTTPRIVPPGAMILQPSDERRRSGSHYTPRSLTEPIVRTTLRPVLEQLGDRPTPEQILALKVCDPAMGSGAFLVEADRQLADELGKAWHNHNCVPAIPPDEDEILFARRLVVQRCLYGVDKNPMAVDLAKLALWLATLAKDHAFTFVDHALRCGDSLVGLTRKQIAAFHWQPTKYVGEIEHLIKERIQQVIVLRARIQNADETVNETTLRLMLKESQEALDVVRTIGDLGVAAFFSSEKPKERENARSDSSSAVTHWLRELDSVAYRDEIRNTVQSLTNGEKGLLPFHWEIEFPEVFQRENAGFEAFIGNPPFLGGMLISTMCSASYLDYLQATFPDTGDRADIVAYFFRHAFEMLRLGGTLGMIATNTISQGDTRKAGLGYICSHGGTIYSAKRRYKWPGLAAVIVSIVHIAKGECRGSRVLDDRPVDRITAYLFRQGTDTDPYPLAANQQLAFIGSNLLGMGFTFDDTNPDASPIRLMQELILKTPKNAEIIESFLGGEEINTGPTHAHRRYVVNFADMTEAEASRWPDLLSILRDKVWPERSKKSGGYKTRWWQFGRRNEAGTKIIRQLPRVIVCSQVSTNFCVTFVPSKQVFAHTVNVFAFSSNAAFSVLQSSVNEAWVRLLASSMKDDLRYTPTDCFETFPFPKGLEANPALESTGKEYYEFRAALMVRNNEGLTKTYNRFHDPEEQSPDILRLRELHASMDRTVLDAYGWTDLHPTCEFLLDYEEDEDEDEAPTKGRGRKKPWRYRWPDDFRDEVLARLLELNRQYAEEERLSGAAAEKKGKKASTTKRTKNAKKEEENDLLF